MISVTLNQRSSPDSVGLPCAFCQLHHLRQQRLLIYKRHDAVEIHQLYRRPAGRLLETDLRTRHYGDARSYEFRYALRSVVISVCVCVCVCVFVIISSELHVLASPSFLRLLPMAVARFSSGGVVIRYVLPVLWMTSYFLILQGCSTSPHSGSAVHTQPWAWL